MVMMMSMETSFLKSNSLTKPLSRRPTMAKNKFIYRRHNILHDGTIFPNTITCCDPRSSSLDDNNIPSIINGNWRSFRARLVASRHTTTTRPRESSSNRLNPQPIKGQHPRVSNANRWAHILGKPEKGCLLVATEKLDGVHIFKDTVILLLSMDDDKGPTGIILNRPSSLKSTVPDDDKGPTGIILSRQLYFGGPFDKKIVLVSPKRGDDDDEEVVRKSGVFEEVMEGLYYGSEECSVGWAAEMVKRNEIGVEDVRIFEGYCWWGNAKLKEEIRDGFWKIIACSPNTFKFD